MVPELTGRVSVIIPAYNHQQWIAQAVDSVLQQSYSSWELIIIDDASTDETWSQLQCLVADERIHCHRHSENQGAHATLNEGIGQASGEYIAILNSDDYWHPERLTQLIHAANTQQADMVFSQVSLMDEHGRKLTGGSQSDWLGWYAMLKQELHAHGDYLDTLMRGNYFITTSNFFFRRHIMSTMQGFADLRYVHDYEFVLKALIAGVRLHYLDQELMSYRKHAHNTISEAPALAISENLQLLHDYMARLSVVCQTRGWDNLQLQLQDLQNALHGEWCARLHNELSVLEQRLQAIIDEHGAVIQKQQGWVKDRDLWITERDQWIAERDHLIRTLQLEIQQQKTWLQERDEAIQTLHRGQKMLRESPAFQLGYALLWPLRQLRELFRRVGYAG